MIEIRNIADGSWVGSGGLGWSDELPQPDFDGQVRCEDMWGMSESQETSGVSPDMFAEFVFPYALARRLELIMKDCHTIRNQPQRAVRWVEIAREEAERAWQ